MDQKALLRQALEGIDTLSAKLAASEARWREPIAVVGMSCRLPGQVNSPGDYWALLRDGRSGIREIPAERWDVAAYYDPDPKAVGKMYTKHGGFIDSIDTFDAAFFGISPREALTLDPQHRLLLECAWEALEDAAEAPDRLTNTQTGVYVGITTSDYARLLRASGEESDVYSASGTALNAAAGRISFTLGLQGPSMAIDTACSSSLVAAHTAVQALRAGECDQALVGGVNVMASPDPYVLFSRWGMIAADGECRTFDEGAAGFVRGEGCGVLVLKRLRDAQADGNRVYAVIRGSAVNQDGPSSGLSVPNGLAQQKVIRRALQNAGLSPADVDFVEAHGTGTTLGDPIEVEALGEVYGPAHTSERPLMLGSVKPSIGHLESAAGAAALMKLVLTVHHGQLPPQRNYRTPNPRIDWERYPLRVVERLQPWAHHGMRVGAVSGFGFSGTNVHMIVEAPPQNDAVDSPHDAPAGRREQLLVVSARTESALRESAARLADAIAAPGAPSIIDTAHTLLHGRAQLPWRAAVVGSDATTLHSRLGDVARGEPGAGARVGVLADRAAPRIAFLYTGQGSQYAGMGLSLADVFPVFRAALEECDALLRRADVHLLDLLRTGGDGIHQTGVTQPALFAVEYALTELLASWGIRPSAVLGHSVGEYVAACTAGLFSLEDGIALIAERGRLMQALPGGGGMLAVSADADVARDVAAGYADRVSVAALNGPQDVVLSGDSAALARIAAELRTRGFDTRELKVSHAFHSPLMDPMLAAFEAAATGVHYRAGRIPFVSNVTGRVGEDVGRSGRYWRDHVRQPVAFEASMRHLVEQGYRLFVEVGPKPVLTGMARRFLPESESVWVPTLRARPSEAEDMLESLGALFTAGARPDWERALERGRRVRLPTYPFQRKRIWIKSAAVSAVPIAAEDPNDHPLLGRRLPSPLSQIQFACALDPERRPILRDHVIGGKTIVPAAAFIEMAAAAARVVLGTAQPAVEAGELRAALVLDDGAPREVQAVVSREEQGARFELFSRQADGSSEWTSHMTCHLSDGERGRSEASSDARTRCTEDVDVAVYQQRMREVGLEYGPSFLALSDAWRGTDEAYGELTLPADDAIVSRLTVHPGLLDAAFHLIGLALPAEDEARFYLPIGFEAAQVLANAGVAATAHARVRASEARRVVADVTLWNADGDVAVLVRGLQVRPVTREQFHAALGVTHQPDLLHLDWQDVERTNGNLGGRWLVMGGEPSFSQDVSAALERMGASCEPVDAAIGEIDLAKILSGTAGILDLRTLEIPDFPTDAVLPSEMASHPAMEGLLALLRQLATVPSRTSTRLVLPTRGAQGIVAGETVNPLASQVWGLATTVAAETGVDVRLIDLDDMASAVPGIVEAAARADQETHLALRSNVLMAARLRPLAGPVRPGRLAVPTGPYVLSMRERGTLDGLGIQEAARLGPGPGQVEIEVIASGLNFRDVLNLLDMYPGPAGALGNECCGRVVAVASDVKDVRVGDLVTCIAEATFASHVIADASLTFQVPATLSYAQAAVMPIAHLTAYLALHETGGMRAGDRVLIHAGAGGVGLAAVHMALAVGADVIATAGSERKRDYLRSLGVRVILDSRTAATAEQLRDATDGHGIDLLLNSLTGAFIDEGLNALAPGGRFLEIGLRELRSEEQVRAIRDDVSYHTLLLGEYCRTDPALVRRMFDAVCDMFAMGTIPAPKVHTFAISESPAAFHYMAKARHIGRVAVLHPTEQASRPRADATYVVTGGLRGLGLEVAEWLAADGAGHLIVVGRSAPGADVARRIEALRDAGASIEVVTADVSRPAEVTFLSRTSARPIRGIVHAAGITDDAALSRTDSARLSRVLSPKADGLWNLVRTVDANALDFLVLFSSGSALLGSPGQAAYSGANAFLDGSAHQLRALGANATSVNWGAWSGVGMAARIDARTEREWESRGVRMLTPAVGIGLLQKAIRAGRAQVAALHIEWSKFVAALEAARRPGLLSELHAGYAGRAATQAVEPAAPAFRDQILAVPARHRVNALTERLRREVAAVIGTSDPNDVELNTGLMEQGMDSLMTVELSGRIGRLVGVTLPSTFAFEYPTINALARHLLEQIAPSVATGARVKDSPQPQHDIDIMTDDELEAELRRELDRAGF